MSQKTLYPLLLSDNLHAKVWGGTRIKPMKGLAPDSERIGESWECSAVPGSESVVENGIFAGRTLNSLVEEYGEKLLGKKVFKMYGAKFPLLIKFIDAEHDLSIQVHPDNKMAKEYHDSFGKTEMWWMPSRVRNCILDSNHRFQNMSIRNVWKTVLSVKFCRSIR